MAADGNLAATVVGLAKNVLERFTAISGYALPENTTFNKDAGGKPTSWICEIRVPDILPGFRCGVRQHTFYGQAVQRKAARAAAALQALEYLQLAGLGPDDIQNFQVLRKPAFYTTSLEGRNHIQTCVLWQLLKAHPNPVPITKLQLHPDMPKARQHDEMVRHVVLESMVPQGLVQATANAKGELVIGLVPLTPGEAAMTAGAVWMSAPGSQCQQAWQLPEMLLEKLQAAYPFAIPTTSLVTACTGAPALEVQQALSGLAAAQLVEEEVSFRAGPGMGSSFPADACWRWLSPSMQNTRALSAGIMV